MLRVVLGFDLRLMLLKISLCFCCEVLRVDGVIGCLDVYGS